MNAHLEHAANRLPQVWGTLLNTQGALYVYIILLLLGIAIILHRLIKAKAELRQIQQTCWNLQAVIIHEIRTPLYAINKLLDLSCATETQAEKQQELLKTAQESTHSLLELLDDMLTQSKLETGKLILNLQPTHLPTLVQDLTRIYSTIAQEKRLHFDVDSHYQVSDLMLDGMKLRQILNNLLSNATKFTPQGHVRMQVHSSYGRPGWGDVEIQISDSGIGMPKSSRQELFTPFSEAGETARQHYGGTGLGLYLCQQLTRLMNGTIQIDSQPGQGTRLLLRFEFALATSKTPQLPTRAFSGIDALVADDDRANQMLLKLQLEQLGLRVHCCNDGKQALRAWAQHRFDIVFCDLHMPELNGAQLIKRIRRLEKRLHKKTTPIIMISAAPRDVQEHAEVDYCLNKPVSNTELQQVLGDCLHQPQPPEPGTQVRLAVLHQLSQGDRDFEHNFIRSVLKNNNADLEVLVAAYPRKDLPQMAESLHRILGVVRLLGSETFIQHCLMLDKAIREQQVQRIERLLPIIEMEIRGMHQELQCELENEPPELPPYPSSRS